MKSCSMNIPEHIARAIVDPKAYGQITPVDDALSWLRRELPLGKAELPQLDPFWVVTRHADILEISRRNDMFHSGDRPTTLTTREVERRIREHNGGSPHMVRSLVQMDAPDHPKFRILTQAWFSPPNLRKIEPRIRAIAKQFVDRLFEKREACDFAEEIAFHYPLHVIMNLIGVPSSDEPLMLRLTQELFGASDAKLNRTRARLQTPDAAFANLEAIVSDFETYFTALARDRRVNPQDDIATVLAQATIDGKPLDGIEATSYFMIVATAGHDTTSSTLAAGALALCENPSEFEKLKQNPDLISGLLEESIRWASPVKHFMRSASEDVAIGGRDMKKGDWIMLSYPSGNRDETVFDQPFQFRIDRTPNPHLAFGYGAHICLGRHLGRLEMRVLWEELLPRLRHMELTGAPAHMNSNFVSGPISLPVRCEMQTTDHAETA